MKRKVIQLAGKTLLVSLPNKWAKAYGIKKGDEVEVEERGEQLVIATESHANQTKEINITNTDPMTKRILGALYKKGYTEMHITFTSPKELETAQEVIRQEFTGFEITDLKKNKIIAKKISTADPREFDTILRRMFLIILSMGSDGLEEFKKNQKQWLQTIALRDKDTNKLADFCRRILALKGGKESIFLYFIVEQLEKIGDAYRDICTTNQKVSKEVLALFAETNAFVRQFYELYYTFDMQKFTAFGKKRYELNKKAAQLQENIKKQELPMLFLLTKIIEYTFDMNGALLAAHL